MIKAIIFDFGGPIVDWEDGMFNVYKKYEEHHNLERDALHNLFKKYLIDSMMGDYHSVTDFIEKTKPSISLSIKELNEVFNEANEAIYVRPEMIDYIVKLKKKYKIALLSNFTSGLEIFLQDIFKIYHLFDVVVSSYNVKMRKPDPRIYEHVLEKLDIQAEEAIFIDDLEKNTKVATELGIRSIVFKDSQQCKKDLESILKA